MSLMLSIIILDLSNCQERFYEDGDNKMKALFSGNFLNIQFERENEKKERVKASGSRKGRIGKSGKGGGRGEDTCFEFQFSKRMF